MKHDYGIKVRPITARNPQANHILQQVHQTIGNIICTFKVQKMVLEHNDPWAGILASTMFAIRATVHTTTQHSPAQLVFGRDSIMNTPHEADWQLLKPCKHTLINTGNEHNNRYRLPHEYNVGDKILLKNSRKTKFNQDAYLGPYTITSVRHNGAVRAIKGKVTDTFDLRNITPYHE